MSTVNFYLFPGGFFSSIIPPGEVEDDPPVDRLVPWEVKDEQNSPRAWRRLEFC